ncbi:type II toxin-antitoxin system VapC family toxin [Patulibacter medicamentivorans]|uniref:type II toxin-antitoxin system VapC family toxin n=1 Tax=Patulibacter medicamentivorans TaxID=1097667 RepID=UPI00058D8B5D|nr:type II toxin-antitoxin system VapC family toxin [Patulibacter medicamentivorans]
MVVDASVIVPFLVGRPDEREPISARLRAHRGSLWAPHLLDAEVGHAIRRLALQKRLTTERGASALVDLIDLPVRRVPHAALLKRAWHLRTSVSFYDAQYVALAEQLDVPLLTADGRLAKAPGTSASIELIR